MHDNYISLDTEYDARTRTPFIMTTCDTQLKTRLYDLKNKIDYKHAKKIAESRSIIRVFHNAPSDICSLATIGIHVPIEPDLLEDTMVIAGLVQSAYSPRGLKPLARIYLKDPCEEEKLLSKVVSKYKRLAKKESKHFSWDQIPKEIIEPYAIKDAVITLELYYFWRERLEQFQQLYDIEKRLIRINVDMMTHGIRVNRKFVKKMFVKNDEQLMTHTKEMRQILRNNKINFFVKKAYKIRGKDRKKALSLIDKRIETYADKRGLRIVQSHNEGENECVFKLREPFFPTKLGHLQRAIKRLGINITSITKTGKLSMDRDTLIKYKDHRFIELKLNHAYLSKQNSTYYGPLLEWYTSPTQNRAKFSVYQSGAKTGRYSVELAQTFPRLNEELEEGVRNRVREAFVPEEDYFFCCMDYSQIELRLFASFSNSSVLINAFFKNRDPYVEMAKKIFTEEEIAKNPKELRRVAKTITLGIIYGMGAPHMMETLMGETKGAFVITRSKAGDILQKFHKTIPVRDYANELTRNLYKTGSLELKYDSELMRFSRVYHVDRDDSYKSPNIFCQGTAAYVLKHAVLRLYDYLDKHNLHDHIRLLLLVHDEMFLEVHNSLKDMKVLKKIKNLIEDHKTFRVPITSSAKVSDISWGKVKEISLV
jgi:DNA polymerase I-like protein with 3'-5' exonuclease and polymerase domains